MKTLNQNTQEFVSKVKLALDNSNWDFEACNPRGNYNDSEKACSYLSTQKFSKKVIKEALTDVWDDLVANLRNDRKEISRFGDENANYAAAMIANQLAFNRVSKFQKKGSDYRSFTNKWHIDETVTFKIN